MHHRPYISSILHRYSILQRSGILRSALAAVSLIILTGCIKNDIPFPRISQDILSLAVEGQTQGADINAERYEATVYLSEDTDPSQVKFTDFKYSEGATADPDLLQGTYDLSAPIIVTLSRWQKYQWVIRAVQEIERRFAVEGQIGETLIDPSTCRIVVRVPEKASLRRLNITDIKLGPEGHTTIVPALTPGAINLSRPIRVAVTIFGKTQDWTIFAQRVEDAVTTKRVDAWSRVIWVYGDGPAGVKNGVQYRAENSDAWIDVPADKVVQAEGSGAFSTCISGVEPLTKYVVRTVSGTSYGEEVTVTTAATADIPDGNFEYWHLNGKVQCPWPEGGPRFWDTGNTGTALVGMLNVTPSDDTPTGSGKSARCETIKVLGKLAAGSIYTGEFGRIDGTNGILKFGQKWTLRPVALRGSYKFKSSNINVATAGFEHLLNRPDSCHIYVALADWTAPYEIRTNPKNRQLFDPSSPSIIAYGELVRGSDTSGWEEFTIKLKYRATDRVPTYLQITCAGSKYGDYFTGGVGTTLWVDQLYFQWE